MVQTEEGKAHQAPLLRFKPKRARGKAGQNTGLQKPSLDLTHTGGIFFQRQFQNERNVKGQIFQITFSPDSS